MSDIAQQWCQLHNCHQEDPAHPYHYPDCEEHLRPSTSAEDEALLASIGEIMLSPAGGSCDICEWPELIEVTAAEDCQLAGMKAGERRRYSLAATELAELILAARDDGQRVTLYPDGSVQTYLYHSECGQDAPKIKAALDRYTASREVRK